MTPRKPKMSGYPDPELVLTPTPADRLDLAGRRFAVVGGTDGLGRAIAHLAAARGAEVTVVGRTLRDAPMPGISFLRADLASMEEGRRVGRELPADLDVILFTTGILAPKARAVTADGLEVDMAISALSRLAVLQSLIGRLTSPRPRVFIMGFPGAGNLGDPTDLNAERSYVAWPVHMNTVAVNEAMVIDLASRHPRLGVYGLNPGLIKTNIRANLFGGGSLLHRAAETLIGLFTPTPERYAQTVLPVLVAPELEAHTGRMFGPKGTAILPTDGMTPEHARAHTAAAEALIQRATG